jgi:hypothetical protein
VTDFNRFPRSYAFLSQGLSTGFLEEPFLLDLPIGFHEAVKRGERLHVGRSLAMAAPRRGRSLFPAGDALRFPDGCFLFIISSFPCGPSALAHPRFS